ncbi:uncharacterized protein FFB20_08066 [Fusarium fujikuroi]|uniref:Uncharacterized protein n=1 Tax=Fusarium fujikuroi TaxID=5127 RepID=A0A2H3SD26_FUSFU|nr:uncharacterized protein FFB20_08066 [Fusarium fujikuroi]SCN89315.1 uncharacterized protein FFE2_06680 [Fusarium fujikuroi]SCN99501.1 uncharacterized protein FFM5_07210 [Fusarium fujikuroi]SCO18074.1 uncharacterized protein FFC1_13133 [Fusarium fujikuroi]SCO38262.1 uncharacterized protein FFMR_05012 [Fusarium fujikuroi]
MNYPSILHELRGFYQSTFSEWLQGKVSNSPQIHSKWRHEPFIARIRPDQTKKFVVYNQIIT